MRAWLWLPGTKRFVLVKLTETKNIVRIDGPQEKIKDPKDLERSDRRFAAESAQAFSS